MDTEERIALSLVFPAMTAFSVYLGVKGLMSGDTTLAGLGFGGATFIGYAGATQLALRLRDPDNTTVEQMYNNTDKPKSKENYTQE